VSDVFLGGFVFGESRGSAQRRRRNYVKGTALRLTMSCTCGVQGCRLLELAFVGLGVLI